MTIDYIIAEVERLWGLGWGGWHAIDDEAREGLLGWWWAYTGQEEAILAATKAKTPQPPRHRVVSGKGAGRGR